jgi:hypothetical protein
MDASKADTEIWVTYPMARSKMISIALLTGLLLDTRPA